MGDAGHDLAGADPAGQPTEVDASARGGKLALLFLTSSCQPCRVLWATARDAGLSACAGDCSLVIVTPSPSTESRRRVAELAPPSVRVVMSSDAWLAYGVTRAPWLAVLDGGVIAGEGPAPADWTAVVASVTALSADRPAPPRPS